MAQVLGIDAAWKRGNASGVALVRHSEGEARLLALAPSCAAFVALPAVGGIAPPVRHAGRDALDPVALLAAARRIGGEEPAVIAVDMPLARGPIERRRVADDAVSRAWGAVQCSTHSPTQQRPGALAAQVRERFGAEGYNLATERNAARARGALVETYPHPIAMTLAAARLRLPYKESKRAKYHPELSTTERKAALLRTWGDLLNGIGACVLGAEALADHFRPDAPLKQVEDMLDALLCAIAGLAFLTGDAEPYGDADAAIWLPVSCRRHLENLA